MYTRVLSMAYLFLIDRASQSIDVDLIPLIHSIVLLRVPAAALLPFAGHFSAALSELLEVEAEGAGGARVDSV